MARSERTAAIEARGLGKTFAAVRALEAVDLCIGEGESVALLGPNGAGKTTLVRLLTLGLAPSHGSLRIAGLDPRTADRRIRGMLGLIAHASFLYDDLTARENLEFFARLYGVERPAARAAELLESVELSHRADDPLGTLSRGMQQRVSIARALVHDPPILFLDEPFTGLDVQAAQALRTKLAALRGERRTLFLVTHHLAQGLELADRWIILAHGRIVAQGRSAGTDAAGFEALYLERVRGAAR
jgi:heme exporter protein A